MSNKQNRRRQLVDDGRRCIRKERRVYINAPEGGMHKEMNSPKETSPTRRTATIKPALDPLAGRRLGVNFLALARIYDVVGVDGRWKHSSRTGRGRRALLVVARVLVVDLHNIVLE